MSINFFEFSFRKYLFLGAICIAQNLAAHWWMNGYPIWMIVAAAFWGVVFFTPLAIDVVPRVLDARREIGMGDLQGVYYTFDMNEVRVLYSQGLVWLATKDVYRALGLPFGRGERKRIQLDKRHRTIPGTHILGISEKYLPGFVTATRSPEAQRFNLWFEREVLHPIHKKVEQGVRVPEAVEEN